MRKIGINMGAIGGLTREEYAKRVKELGFDTVFTGVTKTLAEQSEYAELIASNGLIYENLHAPFKHINDIWFDSEGGEQMIAELLFSVDACVAAGAPILVVHLSSGVKAPSITDIGRGRFERLVEYAAQKGITIAFENQRKIGNISWALENFEDCDNVGFCWDCGHESCFTPGREYMPFFGKKLVCTHIHDNTGVYDADLHLIPFDGKMNFCRFAEHIRGNGYSGPLTLEITSKHGACYRNMTSDEFLQRAADAVKRLRAMVDGE